jgi:3-oxoacyl-[acyl-carrier-protein] synthase II
VSFFSHAKNLLKKSKTRRVVITGVGIVSPIGIGKEEFWHSLISGKTGIDVIKRFDASSFPSQIAAEVNNFDPSKFLTEKQIKQYNRSTQFAFSAAKMAKEDCGISFFDPYRTDVIIGSGASSFEFVDQQVFSNPTAGRSYVEGTFDPFGMGKYNINTPACAIAQQENIRGFVCTVATACASGLTAFGNALDRIKDNHADVVITGATDSAVNHFTLNLFAAAGFLNTENQTPKDALCPFDLRRTRSVLGEASGILVLEEYGHAIRRGAQIYAEVVGFHQEYENVDEIFRTDKSGERWSETIRLAIPKDNSKINYINAHATSDVLLDAVEVKALTRSIGEEALSSIPASSIKGNVGSPFAAAGALQLIATSVALSQRKVPPSYNYKVFDPECNVQVPLMPERKAWLEQALVNGHAYGGVNASVVLRSIKS